MRLDDAMSDAVSDAVSDAGSDSMSGAMTDSMSGAMFPRRCNVPGRNSTAPCGWSVSKPAMCFTRYAEYELHMWWFRLFMPELG